MGNALRKVGVCVCVCVSAGGDCFCSLQASASVMEDGWESSVKNVSYLTQPSGPGILAVDSRTHSQTGNCMFWE